jgi:cell division septation protein DedD
MAERKGQDERGLSARQLILVFLAGVAVCGVFFSLGFLVGFNERSSRAVPVTERVTAPAVIPPAVNPPLETAQPAAQQPAASTAAANPPAALPSHVPAPESKSSVTPASSTTPPATPVSAPKIEKQVETAPTPPPATSTAAGEVGVGYTIQVAASRTKQDAEALVNILKTRGYPVFLVTPEYTQANDNLFRVQVGPFTSREDAEKVRAKLAQEGFKPFIKH